MFKITIKLLLILCVLLQSITYINTENKLKLWKSLNKNFNNRPNLQTEFINSQFTPFNAMQFLDNLNFTDDQQYNNITTTTAASTTTTDDKMKNESVTEVVVMDDINFNNNIHINTLNDEEILQDRIKPFKNFIMNLYANYYKIISENNVTISTPAPTNFRNDNNNNEINNKNSVKTNHRKRKPPPSENLMINKNKKLKKIKRKKIIDKNLLINELKFNVGAGVNVSLNKEKELVNIYLDEDCLKDVFTARGKKHELMSKILPLFILPFLIQSAIIPFIVSTLKLLLIKSIFIGKIAIFLLIISAFKNHVKYSSHDGLPSAPPSSSYYVDSPGRRTEIHHDGYRVEGKPAAWVN